MKPSRLIYRSLATEEVTSNEALRDIESKASENNSTKGITGLLVLSGNTFVQVLEGPALDITELFGRIMADKRHRQVQLVSFESGVERGFDDWNMRLVDLYDLPGEQRALMAAKYPAKGGDIAVPSETYLIHAFMLDARYICRSVPSRAGVDAQPAVDEQQQSAS
ncbi:MAG: BLUF domain-containing protein [Chromatiaceae bacterium]|jgi:hypothetical protein